MKPKVKICGVRRPEDAELALTLGATHLGTVMATRSPRCASVDEARAVAAVASTVPHLLVFKDQSTEEISETARAVGGSHVQLYDPDDSQVERLNQLGFTVYRAITIATDAKTLPKLPDSRSTRVPIIIDAGGGSGKAFDWQLLGLYAPDFVFIAGGIDTDNLADLLRHQPWGIDLSSGVEAAPGVKDPAKLHALFARLDAIA